MPLEKCTLCRRLPRQFIDKLNDHAGCGNRRCLMERFGTMDRKFWNRFQRAIRRATRSGKAVTRKRKTPISPGFFPPKDTPPINKRKTTIDQGVRITPKAHVTPPINFPLVINFQSAVEEDGDEIFTPVPRRCTRYGCDGRVRKHDGRWECDKCRSSYGLVASRRKR